MYNRQFLRLEEARAVGEAALAEALKNPDRPVVIAVVDPMGELIYFLRQDNTLQINVNMAINKAYTAAAFRRDTGELQARYRKIGIEMRDFMLDPKITIVHGGKCLKAPDGTVIGAIGISGRAPDIDKINDVDLAEAGAKALST